MLTYSQEQRIFIFVWGKKKMNRTEPKKKIDTIKKKGYPANI